MSDTDEDIKRAIADAVAIVREDRFEKFVRGRMTPEPTDPSKAPPPKPPEPPEPTKAKRSLWWGEALEEPPEPTQEPKNGD